MAEVDWGSFVNAGIKELVASADPTLNISELPVSERYALLHEIGSGSYGRAVLAQRLEDGKEVVVKQIRLFEMDEKARQDTLTEAKVLAQFNHVNIVHYYECILEGGVLNIVMEYANGGDLAETIARRQREKKSYYSEDEIMFWFVQIVLALFHVHSRGVLHRDLKSQNIFIAEGNLLKLGDFGIARVLNSDTELARTVIGSPYYLSPEICEDRPYNRKSDVWSLGCVLYELATLRRAFDGNSLPALVVKILRGRYPPVPSRYGSSLRGLIESMLQQNPKDRPSADIILRSDFVRHHVERYAAHVVALGLGAGGAGEGFCGEGGGEGQGAAAAAAAALGLAQLAIVENRPRAGLAPRRPRVSAARPPRNPAAASPAPSPAPPAAAAGGVAGVSGGGAAGEALEGAGSSREISGSETSTSTPAEGGSPNKAPPAAPVAGQRAVGGGGRHADPDWYQRQAAALADLQAGWAAQKPASAATPSPPPDTGNAGAPPPGGDGAFDATLPSAAAPAPGRSPAPAAAAALGGANCTAAKAKLAELRLQRDAEAEAQRRAIAAQREQRRAAAAKRTTVAAKAVRNRVVERQKDVERQLAEQRAEQEAKQRKALELAVAIKAKEELRRKEAEEAAQHMSAHREQMRAVKARIRKEQLSELGAAFAARMAAVAAGTAEAAAGQVLVVELQPEQPASSAASSAKASPARAAGHRPARAGHTDGGAAAAAGRPPAARRPPGASPLTRGSSGGGGGGEGTSGREKPAADPPWKQRHKPAGRSGEFPEVQIFTPFSSGRPAGGAGPDAGEAEAGEEGEEGSAGEHSGGEGEGEQDSELQEADGVLEVLAQIHTVLGVDTEPGTEDDEAPGSSAAARPLRRPPAGAEEEEAEPQGSTADGARTAAGRLEALRAELECALGGEAFLAAYRCLRALREQADEAEGEGEEAGGAGGGGGRGGGAVQAELERALGPRLHLARQVHKLITLEDAVYA